MTKLFSYVVDHDYGRAQIRSEAIALWRSASTAQNTIRTSLNWLMKAIGLSGRVGSRMRVLGMANSSMRCG